MSLQKVFKKWVFQCYYLNIKYINELLVSNTTFWKRCKAPLLNSGKSDDWVKPLLTFEMEKVKHKYMEDSFQKYLLL